MFLVPQVRDRIIVLVLALGTAVATWRWQGVLPLLAEVLGVVLSHDYLLWGYGRGRRGELMVGYYHLGAWEYVMDLDSPSCTPDPVDYCGASEASRLE